MRNQPAINNYEIITATRVADLQDRVKERIREGWQPNGGVCMLHEDDAVSHKPHIVFAQAVVTSEGMPTA
ncbi:MAG TPA: DUF1737 domain-containing protein [Bryobacteraceae bacterium]|nr:DUF1737 domain-containing protein [Bryobacteraceae bacterium]